MITPGTIFRIYSQEIIQFQLLSSPLFIWTQTSELSPSHIFRTGSLLSFDAFLFGVIAQRHPNIMRLMCSLLQTSCTETSDVLNPVSAASGGEEDWTLLFGWTAPLSSWSVIFSSGSSSQTLSSSSSCWCVDASCPSEPLKFSDCQSAIDFQTLDLTPPTSFDRAH